MLLDLAGRHRLDLSRSVMVGDTDRDAQAAAAAGVAFILAGQDSDMIPPDAILKALEAVTC
jgi:D-glycero-D-manno-heptose 1,7-bisphosphate phosphatase